MRNAVACVGLLLGLAAHTTPLFATPIYTWTDAQGVRQFSQYPPADPEQTAQTLHYESGPTAPETADRLQTIRDVARDLETARQHREEQRAKAAPPPAPPPAEPAYPPAINVLPYPYYGSPYPPPYPPAAPPHWRDSHAPQPEEPEEPAQPPTKGRSTSGQAQPGR